MSGLNFRIYRIDTDNTIFGEVNIEEIPAKIIDEYNRLKESEVYVALPASEDGGMLDENKKILFFKKNVEVTPPHSWKNFFEEMSVEFGPIRTEIHHIVGFIVDSEKEQVLALSTGQAYVSFEKYVDYHFPIEVAKKIVDPEIKAGEIKSLTGYLQASSLQFRRPRRIPITEAISSIWTQLSGYINSDTLTSDEFKEVFGEKKKVSVEIKASIGIKQRISNTTLLSKYVDWLLDVYLNYPVPSGSEENFGFLEAVRKLDPRKNVSLLERLNSALLRKVSSLDFEDFVLCHRNYSLYLGADRYKRVFDRITTSMDYEPTVDDVLADLVTPGIDVNELLEKCRILAEHDSEQWNNQEGTVKELLCGEISIGDYTYFLLNKEWYELRNDFIELIKTNFIELTSDDTFTAGLDMGAWTQEGEPLFNKSFRNRENFIVGDSVLTENIELFDLLHWDQKKVYIIHVKSGFNASVRDVTSQIFNAAQIIENDMLAGKEKLKKHFEGIQNKYDSTINETQFLNVFDKERIYVLGYGCPSDFTDNPSTVRSNIAKLELVQLRNDMRRYEDNAQLKIQWIEKP